MADARQTIEYVMIGLVAYQLARLWWRLRLIQEINHPNELAFAPLP